MEQVIEYKNSDRNLIDLIAELTEDNYMSKIIFSAIVNGNLRKLNGYVRWSSVDFQTAKGFYKEQGTSQARIFNSYFDSNH